MVLSLCIIGGLLAVINSGIFFILTGIREDLRDIRKDQKDQEKEIQEIKADYRLNSLALEACKIRHGVRS